MSHSALAQRAKTIEMVKEYTFAYLPSDTGVSFRCGGVVMANLN